MTTFLTVAPRLAGLVVALPSQVQENTELAKVFGAQAMADIIRSTGIERRSIASTETVSELGTLAGQRLLDSLGWARSSVEALVVVTQTPDYPLPATACLMQQALGLSSTTLAMDINLGCSGYVYGLSVINGFMQTAGLKRALLVCGDITSKMIPSKERSLQPLFGDAVAVTALENAAAQLTVDLGTDGSGALYLMSATGGIKSPGEPRLIMDGVQVMAFSLKRVAPSVERVLKHAGQSIGDVDAVVFHQANAMMLSNLGRKVGAKPEQVVLAVRDFGNTSSASIPLALCDWLQRPSTPRPTRDLRLLLSGFGVGWSWSTALWTTSRPDVVELLRSP